MLEAHQTSVLLSQGGTVSNLPYTARILVVDDIAANRDLLSRLRRLGLSDILEAADGAQALDIIRSTPVDLVLLDIMMPVMTGFDVLEVMATEGRIAKLPVIVISALNEMDSIVRAIELGAEDFLFKPFDPTLLRARVRATLEKKQLHDRMRESSTANNWSSGKRGVCSWP